MIEAGEEIGGRVRHINWPPAQNEKVDDNIIELGANWIQGSRTEEAFNKHSGKMNPLMEIAKKYNLQSITTNFSNSAYYQPNGKKYKNADFSKVQQEFNTILMKLRKFKAKRNGAIDMDIRTALKIVGWRVYKIIC
jgi:hypothetical protein